MMKRQVWLLSLLILLAACAPLTEAPTAILAATPLPTPASAEEAALINLRPLTASGLAWFGDWAPDGESLVYTVATEPPLLYGRLPGWPEFEVWWMHADGSGARRLAQGHSPFFSADGQTVFFLHQPLYSNLELWAVNVRGGAPRRLLEPVGGLTVHQLDDGRLVVSESGTYSPLRLFDPEEGTLRGKRSTWPKRMAPIPGCCPRTAASAPGSGGLPTARGWPTPPATIGPIS